MITNKDNAAVLVAICERSIKAAPSMGYEETKLLLNSIAQATQLLQRFNARCFVQSLENADQDVQLFDTAAQCVVLAAAEQVTLMT